MTLHDAAILNDTTEADDEYQDMALDNTDLSQLEVHVSHADSIKSTDWQLASGSWSDFVKHLLDHREQAAKDGFAYLPGVLRGQRRINADVERLGLVVFDLDREQYASVCEKAVASGWEGVMHSTHSHLITCSVIALSAYQTFAGHKDVQSELVARYLTEAKRVPDYVLEDLRVVSVNESCGTIEVHHSPIEKYRLVFLPDTSFSVDELLAQGMSLPAIKELWKAVYCAIGRHLGLDFDTACTDLARAYYLPSHAPGAPYVAEHLPGRPLPLQSFLSEAMERSEEPPAGSSQTSGIDSDLVTDRDGRAMDLKKWDARHRGTCPIVEVVRGYAPGLINECGDNTADKQHIYCPFEQKHSNPNQGSGTFVANPGRHVNGQAVPSFTIHCQHDACSDRTRLDFLKALIVGGHLTFADLEAKADATRDDAVSPEAEIAKYARKWAFVNAGGKVLLLNTEERDLSKALFSEADFARIHRWDYAATDSGRDGTIYWAREFLKRPPPETKFYKGGFCFKPGSEAPSGCFNLYRGLHVTASPSGSCDLFRELIYEVWARGNQEAGDWAWEYLLHMVAHPGERLRTSIAIRGSHGSGKSIVFDLLRQILGDMLLVVDNQNIVLGTFNESLIGKLGVVLEEAAFAGDKGGFQKMKNLITGTTVYVNPKNKAPFAVENYCRVFLISNEEHFVNLEHGDRRYTIFETSDAWKGSDKFRAASRPMDQSWRC